MGGASQHKIIPSHSIHRVSGAVNAYQMHICVKLFVCIGNFNYFVEHATITLGKIADRQMESTGLHAWRANEPFTVYSCVCVQA